jgi:hypothetical protein
LDGQVEFVESVFEMFRFGVLGTVSESFFLCEG